MGHPEPPVAPGGPPVAPPPPPPRQRKWLPTIAVFVVMMTITLGGFFAAGDAATQLGAVGDDNPPAADTPPVEVAPGVSVAPVAGWVSGQVPAPYTARLTNGSGFLDVLPAGQTTDPAALVDEYVAEALQPASTQLQATEPEPVAINNGLPAARGAYVGLFTGQSSSVEGEVTAVILPDGTSIVFDGWATEGQLGIVRDALRQMIAGMTVG